MSQANAKNPDFAVRGEMRYQELEREIRIIGESH